MVATLECYEFADAAKAFNKTPRTRVRAVLVMYLLVEQRFSTSWLQGSPEAFKMVPSSSGSFDSSQQSQHSNGGFRKWGDPNIDLTILSSSPP